MIISKNHTSFIEKKQHYSFNMLIDNLKIIKYYHMQYHIKQ